MNGDPDPEAPDLEALAMQALNLALDGGEPRSIGHFLSALFAAREAAPQGLEAARAAALAALNADPG